MANEYSQILELTRGVFRQLEDVLQQHHVLSNASWEDLKKALFVADISPQATLWLLQRLQQRVKAEQIRSSPQVSLALHQELIHLLGKPSPLRFSQQSPITVVVAIGTNGSGKTTSLAKLAYRLTGEGHKVLLVATGTFQSGGIDPLKVWAERINVPIVCQDADTDASQVLCDALQSAHVRGFDVVLVDTADRQAMKIKCLEELKNIMNAVQKVIPSAPHEILVVADATHGQTVLPQIRTFGECTGLNGVILSKVEISAKMGCAFSITDDLGVPIKFLGTGEKIEQLVSFDPERFVAALFEEA